MSDLQEARKKKAEDLFANADFGDAVVGETGSWQEDGKYLSIKVYWEQKSGPSISGSFGVEFATDSSDVVDTWYQ